MSFPAYSEYQESGIAWVGEMPVHWGIRQLKWLFDLQKRPVRDEDEIVTAFRDGIVTLRKHRREEGFTNSLKEIGYQGIRSGDLIIHAMDGFAGAIGVSDSDGKSTPVYSVCKPKDGALSEYYGRLLRYMALSGFVDSLAKGVRERSTEFRWRDASVLPLPVPPVHEQRAIVQFLDCETAKIDALVAEQERLIALLKEKRQAVISHVVTKGLDPAAPMKDSGIEWLGEIPAHWNVLPLRRVIAKFVDYRGVTPTKVDEGVPLITAGQIKNGRIDHDLDPVFITEEEYESRMTRGFPALGDLLLTTEAPLGEAALIQEEKVSPGQRIILMKVKPSLYLSRYLLGHFRSQFGQSELLTRASGSTASGIRADRLRASNVLVPPLDEQAAIVVHIEEVTRSFDGVIAEAMAAIELMQERRAALISAAVTGKIDVRGLDDRYETEAA